MVKAEKNQRRRVEQQIVRCLLTACTVTMATVVAAAQLPARIVDATPVPEGFETLHYGSDPLQYGRLRLPGSQGRVPVVVIVHGGCWADHLPGKHPPPDLSLMEPLSVALTNGGVATWNIEYRRAGSPGGGWPNTYLDLSHAVDYLRAVAVRDRLDLSRVFVVGHSSGGQLALWLGARAKLPANSAVHTSDPLAIQEIIDIDGPPDLVSAQPVETQYCPMPAVTQFMQGTPAEQPTRYRDGSAGAYLPLHIPQLIISGGLLHHVGTLDTDYKAAAEAKGDSVSIVPVDGGHFELVDPSSEAGKKVLFVILKTVNAKN
jgi:acetyl esterase/lipase